MLGSRIMELGVGVCSSIIDLILSISTISSSSSNNNSNLWRRRMKNKRNNKKRFLEVGVRMGTCQERGEVKDRVKVKVSSLRMLWVFGDLTKVVEKVNGMELYKV